ncbi:MAG TPA: hypothetical protein P5318_16060 [Candidatus Hydrogenedentes bacterium]|nr:hypothetical protein [Candidatus Hydrogenedentota bacterium]HRT21630.1 hypothetical protein [Candidatus Hydrogenedentota bacterium]HRT63229.1 hypothetical protein [Candidatus Hydrogenedentota bacterium]
MIKQTGWALGLACLLAAVPIAAWAHNPIVINGGPTDAETAHAVKDISVSRVAYHHAKEGQPLLWLTFDGQAGQLLEFQMGLPKIDRYAGLRPATALLGPGLPPAPELPFTVPEGMGAAIFSTEGREPTVFHEEFTGTVDWQFEMDRISLPQDGKYYLVSYLPSANEGKFWIALGKAEVFGVWDLIRMPVIIIQARSFHEIFPWGGILGWAYLGIVMAALGGFTALSVLIL